MITLFNRKEVCITSDLERQTLIRDILAANGIDYEVKFYRAGRTLMRGHTQSTLGMNIEHTDQYTIYVKKDDFEKAKHLISE